MNHRRPWIVVLACLLSASGCQGTANTAVTPSPAASKRPSKTPAPARAARKRPMPPAMQPRKLSALPPSPTPSPEPTDAPPKILSVKLSSTNVRSGETIFGSVLASRNVASVEVRVANYGVTMKKVGVGRFELSYTVGNIPFFLHGTYDMHIVARSTRGDAVTSTLPFTVH